ncbi:MULTISPECIES: alpha/beta fold hydrolase [Salinibaculum]|uniref:alpha/beta fold hydrolase n=1 Tax=Salinibaculum TaxID=2732368 RepID=UPI0030CF1036
MEQVSHDGRETAYRVTQPDGDGPTVLYVHGSGGTHQAWAPQYGPQGPSHPAVAVDLSGHGDSEDVDTPAGSETLAAYADDVCAVATATDADVLVGNSLGGAVVQHVLLERALDLRAAVLAGSGAKLAVHESLREALAGDFEAAIRTLHEPDRLFHDPTPRLVDPSTETMRSVGRAVTERDFLTCHTFDVRERVGDVDVPVLALVGEHDQLTPVASHEFLAGEIPDGQLALVEDAAHLAMLEQPTAFSSAVGTFLDGLGG